jgi:general secretion pathway protein D
VPKLPSPFRSLLPVAACCTALVLTVASAVIPLSAGTKERPPLKGSKGRPSQAQPEESADSEESSSLDLPSAGESQRIRLNYLRANWKKVLNDVAKSMDKELVADEIPARPFSRIDRKQHSPEEALRILNRELAGMGQKLVVKGDHLVLISTHQQRMDYSPAVIKGEDERRREAEAREAAESAQEELAQLKKRRPAQAQAVWPPRGRETIEETESESETPRRLANSNRRVRSATVEEEDLEETRPLRKVRRVAAEVDADTAELIETEIRLSNRDAGSIEKSLLKAFKGSTQRVARGPGGLEGFAILAPSEDPGARRVRFKIGIDEERNSILVEATEKETPSIVRLIRALDKLPPGDQGSIRAVPSNKADSRLAKSLQTELDQLVLATRMQDAREAAGDQADEGDQVDDEVPPPAGGRPGGGRAAAGAQQGMPIPQALQGSLKGEVSIEAVPDLNVFIIKGNEKDVETVMSILKEIEKLSEASAPLVRMVPVEHQNSEALATLLTAVYDRISPRQPGRGGQASTSSVALFPVARPNALLIVAPQADLDAILELLEQLDQPSDPTLEYKVFRLKYAVPSQVSDTIKQMYPVGQTATPGQGGTAANNANNSTAVLAPRVVVVPDSRTNSVIVQARPRDMAEVSMLINDLDTLGSDSVNQLRIFPLKNALADELAVTLQQAIIAVLTPARVQAQNQGLGGGGAGGFGGGANQQIQNEDLRDVKSSIIEFLDAEGEDGRAVRSGIISDIRINPDARTNSIVVTAPAESIALIETLIKRLDKPASAVAEIKVFPLSNADASGMVALLEGLFSAQAQRQRAGGGAQGGFGGGLPLAGTDDASSTLIPLRFSVDTRTNSIIAIGGGDALEVVHAVLLSLDSSDVRQRQNRVYALKNSPAADVSLAIQQFLQSRRQIEQQDPALVSAFDQFDREVVVVPEPVGNKLLISATPRYFDDIIQIIRELDQVPKQVIIQALLVEVELTSNDEWGVELGIQDSILFDRSAITELVQVPTTNTSPNGVQTTTQTIVSQSSTPGFNFNNQPLGNNTSPNLNTERVGGQALSSLAVGRVNGDLGYGGLVLAAGSESVSVLLRALAARRRIDVLSRPQVQALDNQLATIQVGQEVPRVDSFTINQNTGNATPIVLPRNVGIILEVIPRISPEGMVVMEVSARKDALNPQGIPLFTNPNGSVITSPIIDTTNAQTSVIVRTGQTIVLGGMITSSNTLEERKVPLLGDIPILGQLFRADFKRTRRTELLIFLTPRIIRNEEEAEMIKEIETQRINFIECQAESIHGPLFGVPGEDFGGFPTSTNVGPMTSPANRSLEMNYTPAVTPESLPDTGRPSRVIPPPPEPDSSLDEPTLAPPAGRSGARRPTVPARATTKLGRTKAESASADPEADEQEYADFELAPVRQVAARAEKSASASRARVRDTTPAAGSGRPQGRRKPPASRDE